MANDLWATPPEVIKYIEREFGEIKLDLCASDESAVCDLYITEQENFLDDSWLASAMVDFGALCWMNPPYSNPLPFVMQAITWSIHGYAVAGILNNDTSPKWFAELQKHAAVLMPIVGGRIAFLNADREPVKGNNKPQIMFYLAPFGSKTQQTKYVNIKDIYN
tara:strand:- start:158 stop:646 length:489 start_codon:yes stop_codon:yes gene_type:complete